MKDIQKPLISVVMSNYNGKPYLAEAIDSVLSQTYENFEFILIDDGSTDGSVECMEAFAGSHPKIHLIRLSENMGQANGFNIGIQAAKGTLISFMDSDDLWDPNKLVYVERLYSDNPRAVIFQHNLRIRHGQQPSMTSFRKTLPSGNVFEELRSFKRFPQFIPTAGLTFTKEVLTIVGPIPTDFRTCGSTPISRRPC